MDTESPAPVVEKGTAVVETSSDSSDHGKKNQRRKVPKRIHKAEREKLKREHLNELFLGLANALELSEQNGKASILNEAARFVKDMLSQIKHLKAENTTLLSESQYLNVEKKELEDEKTALEAEVIKLQSEVKAREVETNLDLNLAPPISQQPEFASQNDVMPTSEHAFQQSHIYVFPVSVSSSPQVYPVPDTAMPTSNVRKPQPRYPTPADVWPSEILEKRPRLLQQEVQDGA